MRKSSQGGRRVSQPLRLDADELKGSSSRRTLDRRTSGIPQPRGRSSSEHRDGRMSALPPMKRSKSQLNVFTTPASGSTTPIRGLQLGPTGSAQSQRYLSSPFSDGGRSSRKSTFSGVGGGKPGRVTKDTRPLSDKSFQQLEIQKITSFLHVQPDALTFAPKGINLRQLTMKLFVDLVDYLMSFIDESININMTNYVTEIPLIMKRWGYLGNINSSWLKTVNTPHAFPYVVGLLSWLTTLALAGEQTDYEACIQDALQNGDDGADDESFVYGNAAIYITHLMKQYKLWNAKDEAGEEKEEREFILAICNRNNVSDSEMRKVAESVNALEIQLNCPKEKAELEAAQEEERKYNEFLKDYNSVLNYKVGMEEYLNTAETMLEEEKLKLQREEETLRNIQNSILELKALLSNQTMTVEERDELLRSLNELNSAIRENEEYIAVVSNQCYADDLELVKKSSNMKKKTQAYNTVIIKESCWFPELEALKNDTNVLHQGADSELAELDSCSRKMQADIEDKHNKLFSDVKLLKDEFSQEEEQNSRILQEVKQYAEKKEHLQEAIENIKAHAEDVDEMKSTIETLVQENKAHISCTSLQQAKEHLKKITDKRDFGLAHMEQQQLKAEEFFKRNTGIIQDFVATILKAEGEFLRKKAEVVESAREKLSVAVKGK